jgi:hypothetical protein
VLLGAYVLAHGVQNLTPWLGGGGIEATARVFAARAGCAAAVRRSRRRPYCSWCRSAGDDWVGGGFEYALFLTLGALVPLWAGPGRWSVDRLLGIGGPLAGGWALGATVLTIVVSTGREARLRDHAAVRARRFR